MTIPQVVLLALLAVGLFFAWIGAFFAILFTGPYPRPLFDFNVGVLRWGWRVSFYFSGGVRDRQVPAVLPRRQRGLPGPS